jgi:hypothetical protein
MPGYPRSVSGIRQSKSIERSAYSLDEWLKMVAESVVVPKANVGSDSTGR